MKTWTITAEHGGGQSVDHPCTRGVYDDPANCFEVDVEAPTEATALKAGRKLLAEVVEASELCACRRRLSPGSDRWWDSVSIYAERI